MKTVTCQILAAVMAAALPTAALANNMDYCQATVRGPDTNFTSSAYFTYVDGHYSSVGVTTNSNGLCVDNNAANVLIPPYTVSATLYFHDSFGHASGQSNTVVIGAGSSCSNVIATAKSTCAHLIAALPSVPVAPTASEPE
jgi:hypothetical protein